VAVKLGLSSYNKSFSLFCLKSGCGGQFWSQKGKATGDEEIT
jgi:hypothetical protein